MDRRNGERGYCDLGERGRVFHHYLSFTEEPAISPTYEILLSGCSHRCRFCSVLEYVEDPERGPAASAEAIREGIARSASRGLRSVSFVGGEPTVNLLEALLLLPAIPEEIPVVWNTNMYLTPAAHGILAGVVDVFVGDVHFGNDECARELGGTSPYVAPLRESFRRAAASARLLVRHLVVPGHVACCTEPILRWLDAEHPEAPRNVMTGFFPRAGSGPQRVLDRRERDAAGRFADGRLSANPAESPERSRS